MKKIFTEKAPAPGGHYSQATKQAGFIFVSGQLPINPETGEKIFGNIEMQTSQVLKNMLAIVEAAGANLEDIMKVTVYISDIELWAEVNTLYSEFFKDHRPARVIVPVSTLHYGFLIEIDAIAYQAE